jgi:hypothetical protein
MKVALLVIALLPTTSILAYAVQPETPKLPELVQNIFDAVLGLQSSSDDIEGRVDTLQGSVDDIEVELETVVRMETNSSYFNITNPGGWIANYFYDEVRHVSLSFNGGLLGENESYTVLMRIPYPNNSYYDIPILWITYEDGAQWHHVEFDTDHWGIIATLESNTWLAGGYHATSTYAEAPV